MMKKIPIYIFALLFVFTSLLYAQVESNVDRNIITGSAEGRNVVNEQGGTSYDPYAKNLSYEREAIYNLYLYHSLASRPGITTAESKMLKIVTNNNSVGNISISNATSTITVKGYCLIKENVHIGEQPASLMLECNTNVGLVAVFGNLLPKNEVSALFFDPVFVDKLKYRFNVKTSLVTNEAKTSYNIATYVNDRKLSKMGYKTTSVASDQIKTASNSYLKALEQSRVKQEAVISSTGIGSNAVTTTTNTDKPEASDYFITAGINIVADGVKTLAELMLEDLPYLYEIVGGSKVYIDMQVEKEGTKTE